MIKVIIAGLWGIIGLVHLFASENEFLPVTTVIQKGSCSARNSSMAIQIIAEATQNPRNKDWIELALQISPGRKYTLPKETWAFFKGYPITSMKLIYSYSMGEVKFPGVFVSVHFYQEEKEIAVSFGDDRIYISEIILKPEYRRKELWRSK